MATKKFEDTLDESNHWMHAAMQLGMKTKEASRLSDLMHRLPSLSVGPMLTPGVTEMPEEL